LSICQENNHHDGYFSITDTALDHENITAGQRNSTWSIGVGVIVTVGVVVGSVCAANTDRGGNNQ
jgi:hypothetical protein